MISIVVLSVSDAETLACTLSALVEGVVQGLVCEAIVVDDGLDAAALIVADHAGCRVVKDMPGDIVAAMRGDWLLVLEAGAVPGGGWVQAISRHVSSSHQGAVFRHDKWFVNMLPRIFLAPLSLGVLVPRNLAATQANRGFKAMAPGKMVSLDATLLPAGRTGKIHARGENRNG